MSEPTDVIVCEGGLADGRTHVTYPTCSRVRFPSDHDREAFNKSAMRASLRNLAWLGLAEWPDGPEPAPARLYVTYADTGRRTADGRRVFAVEGG